MASTSLPNSATGAGHRTFAFLYFLFSLFVNFIRRATNAFSADKPVNRPQSSPVSEHRPDTNDMATPRLATRPSSLRIVPALPLLPSQKPRVRSETLKGSEPKEGPCPNGAEPSEPGPNVTEPKEEAVYPCQTPEVQGTDAVARLELNTAPQSGGPSTFSIPLDNRTGEGAVHAGFMREALDMARLALRTNETPVGCVFVYRGRVIARGMNATNITRNGTRHAELMGISALLSYSPAEAAKSKVTDGQYQQPLADRTNRTQPTADSWSGVDPKGGHIYPYGQKLHPCPRVDRSIISECTLYVTVEPCVMCASLLRQLHIKKVYFGAVNDKFGGTGGVFRIHMNSTPAESRASALHSPPEKDVMQSSGISVDRQAELCNDAGAQGDVSNHRNTESYPNPMLQGRPAFQGDGGNVEPGYDAEGGWGRDEAVTLLRQFYVQENNRAPVPRKKEGRAARLAAMMEQNGHAGGPWPDQTQAPPHQSQPLRWRPRHYEWYEAMVRGLVQSPGLDRDG